MSDFCKRRITKELTGYEYIIQNNFITLNYKEKQFLIEISNHYPFRPPHLLTCNNKIISYSPMNYPDKIWKQYRNDHNRCICCENMMCPDNWSPARVILHVVDEYLDFINALKTIIKKNICKKLRLPDDMIYMITSYL